MKLFLLVLEKTSLDLFNNAPYLFPVSTRSLRWWKTLSQLIDAVSCAVCPRCFGYTLLWSYSAQLVGDGQSPNALPANGEVCLSSIPAAIALAQQ